MNILNGNWVDLVIIIILLYFVLDSFRHNFFVILTEFISFLFSLLLGLRFYKYIADFLTSNFALSNSISKAIGFFIAVSVLEGAISFILLFLVRKIPQAIKKITYLNYFRMLIGFFDGILLLSFFIPLILAFPVPPYIKESISQSRFGSYISNKTASFEKKYADIFGGIFDEGLNILTVNPGSDRRIALNVDKVELSIDYESEDGMLVLVNNERVKAGLKPLTIRSELVGIARDYATDMWKRDYFSHYSPEGEDVSDRLEKVGANYRIVGENLAYAPTLSLAHNGLMNSEGHRENILNPVFTQASIGVVDNGIYGKIFVQIFTD